MADIAPDRFWQAGKTETPMGLFKPETYRFFVAGFAAGALFVVAKMDTKVGSTLGGNVVSVAEAQAAR